VQRPGSARESVVICAFNEEHHIDRLLRSLANQSLHPAEVIVVDDGSRDATADIARGADATLLRQPHRGPAQGRNVGAQAASGEILVFLDGDMSCDTRFVERLTEPIRLRGATGTFTRDIFVGNSQARWAHAYSVIRQLGSDRLLPPEFPDVWDNFRAITREAFLSVGGYDDIGYGEDRTLARKLGEGAVVAEGAMCWHYNPETLSEIFTNGRWIGRGQQVRELDRPWRDHLPHRVVRWILEDRRRIPYSTSIPARVAYHVGVLMGLADSSLHPGRHWK